MSAWRRRPLGSDLEVRAIPVRRGLTAITLGTALAVRRGARQVARAPPG